MYSPEGSSRLGVRMVSQEVPSWNQLVEWFGGLEGLRAAGCDAPENQ